MGVHNVLLMHKAVFLDWMARRPLHLCDFSIIEMIKRHSDQNPDTGGKMGSFLTKLSKCKQNIWTVFMTPPPFGHPDPPYKQH